MLLACCPLGLVVRVGQGSKFHVVALVGVAAGAALFGHLRAPIVDTLSPLTLEAPRAATPALTPESRPAAPAPADAISFSLPTVAGGTMSYAFEGGKARFRHEVPGHPTSMVDDPILLVYVAPPC